MNKFRFGAAVFLFSVFSLSAFGQVGATSSLSGVVVDASAAVIPGAEVIAKQSATSVGFRTITVENGTFAIPVLDSGIYTVTVSLPGFKQAVLNNVKLDAGVPSTVRVTLEVGAPTETVTVEAGAEILQSQTANIATTIAVNQISSLPLVSRNPLDFLVLMPGVNAPGITRDATVNGLPQSTIDITLDGINIQDNYNKTTDGFFTRVPTSLDSVQEVTISTSSPQNQIRMGFLIKPPPRSRGLAHTTNRFCSGERALNGKKYQISALMGPKTFLSAKFFKKRALFPQDYRTSVQQFSNRSDRIGVRSIWTLSWPSESDPVRVIRMA